MGKGIGISYGRLSDLKQTKGDGEERQEQAYQAFCRAHDLKTADETFFDRGRSGYKDEHRKHGDFGRLIALAKDDHFPAGAVVVVEAWDRLGRLRPDKQVELVAELLRTGVSIGICKINDIFTEEDFGTHKWHTLSLFAQLAYQESKQKGERVRDAWLKKKARAREGKCQKATEAMGEGCTVLTRRVPAWVEVVDGKPRLIEGKAAAVREVFRLAGQGLLGLGVQRLCAKLQEAGVPPIVGAWEASYVGRLLRNREVLGEYQPRGPGRKPEGAPIKGYFPAAVTQDEWDAARAGAKDRKHTRGVKGDKLNLFARLVKDARDGGAYFMTARAKRSGHRPTGENGYVLQNLNSMSGATCTSFPYDVFEREVLDRLAEVRPEDVAGKAGRGPDPALVLEGRLAELDGEVAKLKGRLKVRYSDGVADVLQEKEAERPALAAALAEAQWAAAHPPERALTRCHGLMGLLATDPDARPRLKAFLRRAVSEIRLLVVARGRTRLAAVQIFFAGGGLRRDYLIAHTPAHANKVSREEARTCTRSLADVAAPGELDLRDPAHARRLEAQLLKVDLHAGDDGSAAGD